MYSILLRADRLKRLENINYQKMLLQRSENIVCQGYKAGSFYQSIWFWYHILINTKHLIKEKIWVPEKSWAMKKILRDFERFLFNPLQTALKNWNCSMQMIQYFSRRLSTDSIKSNIKYNINIFLQISFFINWFLTWGFRFLIAS